MSQEHQVSSYMLRVIALEAGPSTGHLIGFDHEHEAFSLLDLESFAWLIQTHRHLMVTQSEPFAVQNSEKCSLSSNEHTKSARLM